MPPARSDRGIGPVLAHHYTTATVVTGLFLASLAAYFGWFLPAGGILLVAALALAIGGPLRRRIATDPDGTDPETARALEELRVLYAEGDVGHEEYERRYDAVLERGPEAMWNDPPDSNGSEPTPDPDGE
jgi:uncharacterized membrane protein